MINKGPSRTLIDITKTLGKYASIISAIVCVFSIVYTVKEVADNKTQLHLMRIKIDGLSDKIHAAQISCALTESSVKSHRELHRFCQDKEGCF